MKDYEAHPLFEYYYKFRYLRKHYYKDVMKHKVTTFVRQTFNI